MVFVNIWFGKHNFGGKEGSLSALRQKPDWLCVDVKKREDQNKGRLFLTKPTLIQKDITHRESVWDWEEEGRRISRCYNIIIIYKIQYIKRPTVSRTLVLYYTTVVCCGGLLFSSAARRRKTKPSFFREKLWDTSFFSWQTKKLLSE